MVLENIPVLKMSCKHVLNLGHKVLLKAIQLVNFSRTFWSQS